MTAGRLSSATERVPDAAGHASGEAPHGPLDARQSALLLQQAHIIIELPHRHFYITRVPEDPPNETEEDDNGTRVDE